MSLRPKRTPLGFAEQDDVFHFEMDFDDAKEALALVEAEGDTPFRAELEALRDDSRMAMGWALATSNEKD
jgi:hypothetical protein